MEWLFGKQKTVKEIIREQKRAIDKSSREIDRECQKLENTEKKLIIDIKRNAKAGHTDTARVLARSLVQTRGQVKKLVQMKAQLQSVGISIQTMSSQQAVAEAMKGCSLALRRMNRQIDVQSMQRIMMAFERESGIMEMKEDMVNDVLEDMAPDPELLEEESESIVNQVFEEIGLDITGKLVTPPTSTAATTTTVPAVSVAATTPTLELAGPVSAAPPGGSSSSSAQFPSTSSLPPPSSSAPPSAKPAASPASVDLDSLQARFDALNKF